MAVPFSQYKQSQVAPKTVPFSQYKPQAQSSTVDPMFKSGLGKIVGGVSNIGVGIGTTVGKAGLGLGELALKGVGKLGVDTSGAVKQIQGIKKNIYEDPFKEQLSTFTGKTGQVIGVGATFLAPNKYVTGAQKVVTGATNLIPQATNVGKFASGLAGVLGRAGVEAGATGATSLAMTGGDVEQAKRDAILGGAVSAGLGGLGSAYRGVKNVALGDDATRLLTKALKPTGYLANKVGAQKFKSAVPTFVEEIKKTGMDITDLKSLDTATDVAKASAWKAVEAANTTGKNTVLNGQKLGMDIFENVKKNNAKLFKENPDATKEIARFLRPYMNKPITVPEAQEILSQTNALLKEAYHGGISPANVSKFTLEKQLNLELANALRKHIDDTLEALGTGSAKPLRDKFASLATMSDAIKSRIPKEERLASMSLGDQFNLPMGAGKIFAGMKTGNAPMALEGGAQILASRALKDMNQSDTIIKQIFGGKVAGPLLGRLFGNYSAKESAQALKQAQQSPAGKAVVDYAKNPTLGNAIQDVAKNIHPEDKAVMTRFIDSARIGSKLSDNDYSMATKLMEKFGISQDKSLSAIANDFDKILSGQKKVVGTAVPGSVKKKLGDTTISPNKQADTSAPFADIDERLKPLTDKDGMITVYRASATHPKDVYTKDTFFSTQEKNARYYGESWYKGDPSDLEVKAVKMPASLLKRGGSSDAWQLKEDFKISANSSPSPLLQEARKYKSAEDAINNIGGFSSKRTPSLTIFSDKTGNKANVRMRETDNLIGLNLIEVDKMGQGMGSKIINALKDYADQTGKTLQIGDITNQKFFDKFSFLKKPQGLDTVRLYSRGDDILSSLENKILDIEKKIGTATERTGKTLSTYNPATGEIAETSFGKQVNELENLEKLRKNFISGKINKSQLLDLWKKANNK